MPKNPVVQLVISIVVVAWLLYELFAPGGEQSQGLVILDYVLLLCGGAGIIGSIAQIAFRKQTPP
jgi:hypothetical protein